MDLSFMKKETLWSCGECGFVCNRRAPSLQHEFLCPAKYGPAELEVGVKKKLAKTKLG